ncbi:hypothetical protein FHETE_7143 [Fusarium heterosporum]|uniref:Uncharacterized protein n=1 Tax=Fusarium heterosporum TaxID=42747 RepID=A0A8H5WLH2_FUSHE|nr:hypothetical protein FHETE_7143 [Fusarium heterosporum]
MYFLTTALTALAACHAASAWQLSIANTHDYMIQSGANPPSLRRTLSQDVPSACGVFGQDLPGVGCEQETMDAPSPQGCVGDFETNSLRPLYGTTCTFYTDPGCSGEGKTLDNRFPEAMLFEDNSQGFVAFKCWDNGILVRWRA